MLIQIHGFRALDFPDAPYGEYIVKWKSKKAEEFREKLGFKDIDNVYILIEVS